MNRGMQKKSRLWSTAGQRAFRQPGVAGLGGVPARGPAGVAGGIWTARLLHWIARRKNFAKETKWRCF